MRSSILGTSLLSLVLASLLGLGCASGPGRRAAAPAPPPLPILGTTAWRARVTSNPPGASVYAIGRGSERLLGTTPLVIDIWTEEFAGAPGVQGTRTITFRLPVLRTKDGFFAPLRVALGDKKVDRYAVWAVGLPEDQAPKGAIDIGAGLAYDLKQGRGIWYTGRLRLDELIPASGIPEPLISEVTVDFTNP